VRPAPTAPSTAGPRNAQRAFLGPAAVRGCARPRRASGSSSETGKLGRFERRPLESAEARATPY